MVELCFVFIDGEEAWRVNTEVMAELFCFSIKKWTVTLLVVSRGGRSPRCVGHLDLEEARKERSLDAPLVVGKFGRPSGTTEPGIMS